MLFCVQGHRPLAAWLRTRTDTVADGPLRKLLLDALKIPTINAESPHFSALTLIVYGLLCSRSSPRRLTNVCRKLAKDAPALGSLALDDDRLIRRVLKVLQKSSAQPLQEFGVCARAIAALQYYLAAVTAPTIRADDAKATRINKLVANGAVEPVLAALAIGELAFNGEKDCKVHSAWPAHIEPLEFAGLWRHAMGALAVMHRSLAARKLMLASPHLGLFFDLLFFCWPRETAASSPGLLRAPKQINLFMDPLDLRVAVEMCDRLCADAQGVPKQLLEYQRLKPQLALLIELLENSCEAYAIASASANSKKAGKKKVKGEAKAAADAAEDNAIAVMKYLRWLLSEPKTAEHIDLSHLLHTLAQSVSNNKLAASLIAIIARTPALRARAVAGASAQSLKQIVDLLAVCLASSPADSEPGQALGAVLAELCAEDAVRALVVAEQRDASRWRHAPNKQWATHALRARDDSTTRAEHAAALDKLAKLQLNDYQAISAEETLTRCANGACGALQQQTSGKAAFKRCSRCRQVAYCSVECQRAHWKGGHKAACVPAAADSAGASVAEKSDSKAGDS